MIPMPWREYTSSEQDRLIDNLDLCESSHKAIEEVLSHVAQAAYNAGYRQSEEDHES